MCVIAGSEWVIYVFRQYFTVQTNCWHFSFDLFMLAHDSFVHSLSLFVNSNKKRWHCFVSEIDGGSANKEITCLSASTDTARECERWTALVDRVSGLAWSETGSNVTHNLSSFQSTKIVFVIRCMNWSLAFFCSSWNCVMAFQRFLAKSYHFQLGNSNQSAKRTRWKYLFLWLS